MKTFTVSLIPGFKFRLSLVDAILLLAYIFFCYLMLLIVLQYIPMGTDTAFLNIKQDYIHMPFYLPAFYIHVFTAVLALPAGFTQFSKYLQKNYKPFHRINGRIYVFSVLLFGSTSGFIIGIYANGGILSQIAFCLLAVLWFYFTLMAFIKARQKKIIEHKKMMYRSFALTLSAITLRAWKYVIVYLFEPQPMDVYRIVAWLGWVLNLIIAEIIIFKYIQK
ncbi:MAG: DUF2306 domain-containing protein [Fimbriimonadaceae bacterium]|nr:DUF2306 domain-containing protein [Chitinophagales bacterium]